MALKPYAELRKIDVRPYCEKRDKLDYLNWAKCIDLLYEHGAEKVFFLPVTNADGSSLFMSEQQFSNKNGITNRCYEVAIDVHIDDNVYRFQSPVLNGGLPVLDNSMTQARIWAAQCRAFVKAVAIYTGLGFDLWLSDEQREEKETTKVEMTHSIAVVRDQVFEKVSALNKRDMSLADIAKAMDRTEDEIKTWMTQYKVLEAFEHNIDVLLAQTNDKK